MGNHFGLPVHHDLDGSLVFLWDVYQALYGRGEEHCYGRRRSIVRLIGSALGNKIKLPLRVAYHRQVRRSMFKPYQARDYKVSDTLVTIDEEMFDEIQIEPSPVTALSLPKPDVVADLDLHSILQEENKNKQNSSEEKIADLEFKLNELNLLVQQLLSGSHHSMVEPSSVEVLAPPPPPPPLPPPPPMLTPIQSLKREKISKRTNPEIVPRQLSMDDVLKNIGSVKLRPVERSPGGRPIKRAKTPTGAADSLTEILKKRFASIQLSPEWQRNEF